MKVRAISQVMSALTTLTNDVIFAIISACQKHLMQHLNLTSPNGA